VSREKLRIKNTQLDNLISNLRGEVGEVVTSWVLLRYLIAREREMGSRDVSKDLANESLAFIGTLRNKLEDDIVARLCELAEPKVGQLTFHFAAKKLSKLDDDVREFETFITHRTFRQKRNQAISHKVLPEEWAQHKPIVIDYLTLLRGVGSALRLMKKIDRVVLGPCATYLWREMRKRRYQLMNPPSAAYMLLPYLKLSQEIRLRVVMEEMAEGLDVWSDMPTAINGQPSMVSACRKWGVILLGGRTIALDQYPLQELNSVHMPSADESGNRTEAEPILEERKITAKYRVANIAKDRVSFTPVQRVHRLEDGMITELADIGINLDDKLRTHFGQMNVGDEREFSLTVTVLVGYRPAAQDAAAATG
jgi:hypothetical protein